MTAIVADKLPHTRIVRYRHGDSGNTNAGKAKNRQDGASGELVQADHPGRVWHFAREFEFLTRNGRMFCMMTAYADESYNDDSILCVGGWLHYCNKWRIIEESWRKRINHERRVSERGGFKPINRYHAVDCAGFHHEFSRSNGWNNERQIRFSKRLIRIIGESKPHGIVYGGRYKDYLSEFKGTEEEKKEALYYVSMLFFLRELAGTMKEFFPNERVTVFYDRGNFNKCAQAAFSSLMSSKTKAGREDKKYFVSMAPIGWEHCIPLQPTDLIAYEAFKLMKSRSIQGKEAGIRKSLQAILVGGIPLRVSEFDAATFRAFRLGLRWFAR